MKKQKEEEEAKKKKKKKKKTIEELLLEDELYSSDAKVVYEFEDDIELDELANEA